MSSKSAVTHYAQQSASFIDVQNGLKVAAARWALGTQPLYLCPMLQFFRYDNNRLTMAVLAAHAVQICLCPQGMKACVGRSLMHITQTLAGKEVPAAELLGDELGAPAVSAGTCSTGTQRVRPGPLGARMRQQYLRKSTQLLRLELH
jgi:hypothetical protein